jgi:hypothetical protein
MTNYKLAYVEHISQLLIYKLKKAHRLVGDAQHELEGIQLNLNELSTIYADWLVEKEFHEN